MATLGIKINQDSFTNTNYNECYIHGYTGSTPADVDGTILVSGTPTTVPRGVMYSSLGPYDAYIMWDITGANFSTTSGNTRYVPARRSTFGWEYDNNGAGWVQFGPTANHWIIGRISSPGPDTNSAPGVSSAAMYDAAVRALSDAVFDAWLRQPTAIRCVLVEAEVRPNGSSEPTVRYLASRGYSTGQNDSPPNVNYVGRVTGGIKFTRTLSLEGATALASGDIELVNADGELDTWLDDYWVNRRVRVLVGDVTWPRKDFRPLYTGTLTGIDSRKRDRINLKLGDALQRLNTPVSETKVGGSGPRADDLRPLCFGECHNISPVLMDSTVNEYMIHDGAIEGIIEVRDNGVPVSYTPNLAAGTFRLNQQPAGTITVSAQGAKLTTIGGATNTYSNNLVDIAYWLMTHYGKTATRMSSVDIDMTTMVQFKADHSQPVGIYLEDRQNILEVCNQLSTSLGARLYVNTAGLVSIVQLSLPWAGSTVASIGVADMVDHTLEPKQMVDVQAAAKIGYCKNWTVQSGLTTGLIQEHVALYAEEWLTQTATDSTAASNYNLYTDPQTQETSLLTASDALAEANRRLAIYSTQRKVFKFTGHQSLWKVGLGSYVTLTHPRFGLGSGKNGQVISVGIDPMSPQIEFEVLV